MADPTKPDPAMPDPADPTNAARQADAPGDVSDVDADAAADAILAEAVAAGKITAPKPAPKSAAAPVAANDADADAAADAILAEAMATGKIAAPAGDSVSVADADADAAADAILAEAMAGGKIAAAAPVAQAVETSGEASISAAELEAAMNAFKSGAAAPAAPQVAAQPVAAKPVPVAPPRDIAAELGATPFDAPAFTADDNSPESRQLELLDDVELEVTVELGRAEMYIEDVLRLGVGSVVELDKLAGDPVEIFVNAQLVARGEVLVLNDNFCVRINDIVSPVPEADTRK
ncbi:MAG: flagellar motor switch protein FliN [Phycisphaerae bacterium]